MIVIGHHDRPAIEKLRQAAAARGGTARIVDQRTVVLPLSAETLATPGRLVAALLSFLAPRRWGGKPSGRRSP